MRRIHVIPAWRAFFMGGLGLPFGVRFRTGIAERRIGLVPLWESGPTTLVPVDIAEDDVSLVVTARLPGIQMEDIEVFLARDLLIIRYRKKREAGGRAGGTHADLMDESFQRDIHLPEGVDVEKAGAVYSTGTLRVILPKIETEKGFRKIPVKVSKPTSH